MSAPLKPGYHFHVDKRVAASSYEMPSLDIYHDYYGVSYIVSGDRKFITPHMVGILHAGDVGMTPKDVYHRSSFLSDKPYVRFLVKFTPAMAKDIIALIGQEAFDTLYELPVYHFTTETQTVLYQIFCDMLTEFNRYDAYSEHILKGLLLRLFITILREHISVNTPDMIIDKKDQIVMDIIDYVEHHFDTDPSLETIARHFYLSPSYFSKLFVSEFGIKYSTYLTKVKLNCALNLLASTSLSISEIALRCGFSNGNYFCDVFKKDIGGSPKQFRKGITK